MFCWAIAATTASSVLGLLVYAAVAPRSTIQPLLDMGGTAEGLAILLVLLVGFSFATLVDVRLLTLHRWAWLIAKGGFVALARFPLLLMRPTGFPGVGLFVIGVLPTAVAGFVGAFLLSRGGWSMRHRAPMLGAATRFAGVNYVSLLTLQAPTLALPLIVADNVSKSDYASFFVAFSITAVVFIVPAAVAQVLLVEGGTERTSLVRQVLVARRLSMWIALAMVVASPVIARLLTIAYGKRYQEAADLVVPLIAAVLAWSLTAIYLSEARVRENTSGTLAITVTFAAATLVPALALVDDYGLAGVAVTWLFGNLAAAIVAVVLHARSRHQAIAIAP
jgi:hypothetical protein